MWELSYPERKFGILYTQRSRAKSPMILLCPIHKNIWSWDVQKFTNQDLTQTTPIHQHYECFKPEQNWAWNLKAEGNLLNQVSVLIYPDSECQERSNRIERHSRNVSDRDNFQPEQLAHLLDKKDHPDWHICVLDLLILPIIVSSPWFWKVVE